jgi:hypothetical protein
LTERRSYVKEILVALVVAIVAGGSAPWWWSAIFDSKPAESSKQQEEIKDFRPCRDPSLSLSRGSGPSGTHVTVRGRGYPSDEEVDVRFHTEALPPARTSDEGEFSDDVVIPGTFDAFAPQQFEIRAVTRPTICSDAAPFQLTK